MHTLHTQKALRSIVLAIAHLIEVGHRSNDYEGNLNRVTPI